MGKKPVVASRGAPPPPAYRDEEDAADDVSMHTTRSDYEYDDVPELPSYNDSEAAQEQPSNARSSTDENHYEIIHAPTSLGSGWKSKGTQTPKAAIGSETTIRMDERLNDPDELERYVQNYLRPVQPNAFVRVQGWHWETRKKDNKKEQERVFDFDIVISLQEYLPPSSRAEWCVPAVVSNSDKVHRGSCFKIRAPGSRQDIEVGDTSNQATLTDWCKRYCDSKASLRIFRVARDITGMNTDVIKDELTKLVRATHYRGHLNISFPMADKNVDIYSPHWINRARISWVRWVFYLTFLWIFTWPVLFFMTKRWSVYNVEWRFSYIVVNDAGERVRHLYKVTEEDWVKKYSDLITSLVWERYQGDATQMPTDIDPDSRRPLARGGRMSSTGNANVDSAMNLIRDGVNVWNTMNGRGGEGGWGGDC